MKGHADIDAATWTKWHRVVADKDFWPIDPLSSWLDKNIEGRWTSRNEPVCHYLSVMVDKSATDIEMGRMAFPYYVVWLDGEIMVEDVDYLWDHHPSGSSFIFLPPVTDVLRAKPTPSVPCRLTIYVADLAYYIEHECDAIAFSVYAA